MADIPPPPPGSPPPVPPGYQPPPRSFSDIPPSAQGYGMPQGAPGYSNVPPGYPQARPGISLTSQFTGFAMWSIILGLVSVGVPLVTGLTGNGGAYYFYVLPIFGFIRGVQAVTRGQVIGGIVGIVLNVLGGIISVSLALIH